MKEILSRKSIRSYIQKEVSEEVVLELLHCAMSAPTAGNAKPWKFIVVRDKKTLAELPMDDYTKGVIDAQVAIIVLADKEKEVYEGCNVIDCSAAIQNMLIKATDLQLGTVWYTSYPLKNRMDHIRKVMDLPENLVPMAVLPFGYHDNAVEIIDRFDNEVVFYETLK